MGEVTVPRDALWGAQTQRALDNAPATTGPLSPALVHAAGLGQGMCGSRKSVVGALPRDNAEAIAQSADEVATGLRQPVPSRVVPDRLRNVEQHECQRSHRAPRRRRCLGRPSIPTTTSTRRSRATTFSRPSSHVAAARPDPSSELLPALENCSNQLHEQGARVRIVRQTRTDPPHGRRAGDLGR